MHSYEEVAIDAVATHDRRPPHARLIVDAAEGAPDVGVGEIAGRGGKRGHVHGNVLIFRKLIEVAGELAGHVQRQASRLVEHQVVEMTERKAYPFRLVFVGPNRS